MAETDPMSVDERRKYLHKMRIRYWQATSKGERGKLLDEMQTVTGLHRKSLLRLIKGDLARRPRRKQRGRTYGLEVATALEKIARSLDYPCAERLQPNLVWLAEHLAKHGELVLSDAVRAQLGQISVSTVRRLLPPSQRTTARIAHRKGLASTTFAQRRSIPMRRIPREERQPGHLEVDLVHHCGISTSGLYVHTLQMVDVATGWSECAAILGRSYLVVADAFARLERRLPFPVLEVHPDNGPEFLNHHILHYWTDRTSPIAFSRSRPFHKNDNRFVEENNFSLVRAYVGYARLDTAEQTNRLNQLFELLSVFHNYFLPVMRLAEKRVQPTRIQRIFDQPLPPLDRLCSSGSISPQQQQQLLAFRDALNPAQLHDQIQALVDQLSVLPGARSDSPENVFLTLFLQPEEAANLR